MAKVLERELVRHRSHEEKIARARQRWVTLFSSLWTPWLVFLGALVLYLFAIALTDDAWRVPRILFLALCGLISGWLLLGWTLALVPPMAQRRAARIRAAETLDDMHRAVQSKPHLNVEKLSMLAEVARRLESAWVDGDPALISREVERAVRAMDAETPGWRRADFLTFAKSFATAAMVVLLLRVALFEPYSIPSGSMLPSLRVGDYVLVNKFIYGIQIPFTNTVLFPLVRRPRRGDVAVFKNPLDDSVNLIKRIVGEPGDTVELRSEILYINNVAQPREVADPVSLIEDKVGERWLGRQGTLY
ncbi:MAG: signal peptidase I, partial [Myxococcaceae bacterium]